MTSQNLSGYGPRAGRWDNLCFDGDENKYEHWEIKFLAYMKLRKLKKIILPSDDTLEDDTMIRVLAIENDVEDDKNEQAFAELIQFLDETSLGLVIRDAKDNGRKALAILREHYAGNGKPRIISLYTKLTSLQKQNTETITEYIIRAETTATALKSVGEIVSDGLLIAMIMKGLPSDYKSFIVVTTQSDKALTFPKFKVALRSYEENEKAKPMSNSESESMSNSIMRLNVGRDNNNNNNTNVKRNIICYSCGVAGHRSFECTKPKINKWCNYCRSSSHTDRACRRKQDSWKDHANHARDDYYTHEDENHTFAFCISEDEYLCKVKEDSLLVDCGATTHIVNDESHFISIDENYQPENHYIELADGSRTNNIAKKRGTVAINIIDENGIARKAQLNNVLYVPSYPQNIFSVQAATETGATVNFNADYAELITKDGVKFPIQKQGRLYYLYKCKSLTNNNDVPRSCDIEAWHKILGHCNRSDVINSEKVVRGMRITNKDDFDCTTCILGKQTVTRNRKADNRASVPLEFIHSDLSGAVDPVARDGFKYAITFVDDYSSAIFVYFLKQKSDASNALKKFIADSAPYGKVKRIRTDNGGEYLSKHFAEVSIQNQIKMEQSSPHSPHQNGTAERNWRTLFDMGRSLLLESKLPKNFWTYAVMASAFIRNRCFNQRTKETPFYMLTGMRPDVSKLHVFGTLCYPYIEEYKKKLDARCSEGVFVGYDKSSPSYLVYHPKSNTVRRHRVVKFTERFEKITEKQIPVVSSCDEVHDNLLQGDANNPVMPNVRRGKQSYPNTNVNIDIDEIVNTSLQDDIHSDVNIDESVNIQDNEDKMIENQNNFNIDEASAIPTLNIDEASAIPKLNNVRKHPLRSRKTPEHLKDFVCSHVDFTYTIKDSPRTYDDAINSDDSCKWKRAMQDEMNSLIENDTFTIVQSPEDRKTVGGRWVYSLKNDPSGNTVHKARYVAKGYSQEHGLDYFDTFSPTAKITSIRMMMQVAAEYNLFVHQLDVKTAYLNAKIDCEIFMEQPKGYEQFGKNNETLVWKLNKSLYGLKQSGRNWNSLLHKLFEENGFKQSSVDACVYFKNASNITFIIIWVDDIVVSSNSMESLNETKTILKESFKMKDLGSISWFLGIQFKQNEDGIEMTQSHYLKGVLKKYGMNQCKPRSTPCEMKPSMSKEDVDNNFADDQRRYREIVGSLVYAMTCTRPDLSWIVTRLSQHLANPDNSDWIMLKHALQYVKGTIDFKLTFRKSDHGLNLLAYSDADWGSSDDRKSTTGYYFSLNDKGPAISWKSRKQPTVALSSCEAEYMALTVATQEAMFLAMLAEDFGEEPSKPIKIFGDNQGSIALVKNPINHNRSKHIDIKFHFIRDAYANGIIDIIYIPTDKNIADLMTKPPTKVKLDKFRQMLFGI